ncbi:MAG: hypothetical protein K6G05_05090 [Lachnospiraceae bacterium]|nr:hypothetical protein [Lachnospiraceae bacterium]
MNIRDEKLHSGEELRNLYGSGNYSVSVTFYDGQKWYPREMTEENQWFQGNASFLIQEDGGAFYLDTKNHAPLQGLEISLLRQRKWIRIPWTERGYRMDMDDIDYRMSPDFPVNNGMCLISFHPPKEGPTDAQVRELRLNIW